MGAIHKFVGAPSAFAWADVPIEGYTGQSAGGVTKHVVIGPRDGAANFAVRYFEIAPGGRSALDLHTHDHGVVVLRGSGRVHLGADVHVIAFGDVVYVAPEERHQFENTGSEPLGFLCVVPGRPRGTAGVTGEA